MTDTDHIEIATLRAAGATTRQIESKTGWSHGSVVKSLNQDQNKALIQKIQQRFYDENLERAAINFKSWIHSDPDDKQDKYLKYKASERCLDSAGVLGGSNPSIYIQQTINQDNRQVISPIIKDLLINMSGNKYIPELIQDDLHSNNSHTEPNTDEPIDALVIEGSPEEP